jgi:hypothetical protein
MFSHDLVRREEFLRSPPAPHPGRILFVRRTGDVIPGYIPASLRLAERCRHGEPDTFCLSRRDGGEMVAVRSSLSGTQAGGLVECSRGYHPPVARPNRNPPRMGRRRFKCHRTVPAPLPGRMSLFMCRSGGVTPGYIPSSLRDEIGPEHACFQQRENS